MYAHVSPTGLVGWTRYTERNDYGEPVNNILRVRFPDRSVKDFRHGPMTVCPLGRNRLLMIDRTPNPYVGCQVWRARV